MNSLEKLRALVDKANKNKTGPTGGDNRMQSEVMNTSAIAQMQAAERSKVGQAVKPMRLAEMIQQPPRKS